jgi:hypothetical protein
MYLLLKEDCLLARPQLGQGNSSWIPLDRMRPAVNSSLANTKPSAIYRVRNHLPSDVSAGSTSPPATLGIEIAPLPQLESLVSNLGTEGSKGKEIAGKVDIGKVAEKVVKNVSPAYPLSVTATNPWVKASGQCGECRSADGK